MFLIAQAFSQIGFLRPLDKRLGKLLHDAFQTVKVVRTVVVFQDCVQNFFRKGDTFSLP
jgi:hypothetical protein